MSDINGIYSFPVFIMSCIYFLFLLLFFLIRCLLLFSFHITLPGSVLDRLGWLDWLLYYYHRHSSCLEARPLSLHFHWAKSTFTLSGINVKQNKTASNGQNEVLTGRHSCGGTRKTALWLEGHLRFKKKKTTVLQGVHRKPATGTEASHAVEVYSSYAFISLQ